MDGHWHTFRAFTAGTASAVRIDDGEWEVLGELPEPPDDPQPEGEPEA